MKLLRKIFKNNCTDLQKNLEELELENKKLELKLLEKQKQINKTNAYYKKKLHSLTVNKDN
jgi:hypothetical protein